MLHVRVIDRGGADISNTEVPSGPSSDNSDGAAAATAPNRGTALLATLAMAQFMVVLDFTVDQVYPLQLFDVASVEAHFINPGDTVKLAMFCGPDEVHDVSVFLEIWQPGGTQRPNSHSKSVETFLFLRGTGRAYCDEFELDVRAGQLLVLPAGSLHRIESSTEAKLFAITTMAPDDGFGALVNQLRFMPLDDEEEPAALAQAPDDGSGSGSGPPPLATSS